MAWATLLRTVVDKFRKPDETLILQRRAVVAQERHAAAIEAQIKQQEDEYDPLKIAMRKNNELWASRLAGVEPTQMRTSSSTGDSSAPPQIEFISTPSSPYHETGISHGRTLSTVRIGLKNSGGGVLSNCRVHVEKVAPEPSLTGGLPIQLEGGGFYLGHDDPEKFVDVASHWGHVDKYRFSAPLGGGFFQTLEYIDDQPMRMVVIKVSAFECQRSASFKLWTDEAKSLHLEFVGYVS